VIKKISIRRYRKICDESFDFTQGINALSGTNGTCKTSLLHIISNSFQAVTKSCDWVQDSGCLEVISKVNSISNPKIESLAKGDKQYNDPAYGYQGTLFNVEYINRAPLDFRRHNSVKNNRYAVKPKYQRGSGDTLPYCPVIYLSLARLFPFGEYQDEDAVVKVRKQLPSEYQQEVADLYKSFTHMEISSLIPQKMGDIKIRSDFTSNKQGIDSNTISAGEDNLFMLLTALVSLKYYFKSIASNNEIESILLIDELDATLHPSYQLKFLKLLHEYSLAYKIQIVFTTHSLFLLENALKNKDNVVYLIDNVTSVIKMNEPDIYKIQMYLYEITKDDIYSSKKIPVFTEDAEARVFLKLLFDYLTDENKLEFIGVRDCFHLVEANIGAGNLLNIFSDDYLLKTTMRSICMLDGDQESKCDLNKYIMTLPGEKSPEKMVMDYSLSLFHDNDDSFWTNDVILDLGLGKKHFLNCVKPDIDGVEAALQELKDRAESTHGIERQKRKDIFEKHQRFFITVFKHWLYSPKHRGQIKKFYKRLWILFQKASEFHGINPKLWKYTD